MSQLARRIRKRSDLVFILGVLLIAFTRSAPMMAQSAQLSRLTVTPFMVKSLKGEPIAAELIRLTAPEDRDGKSAAEVEIPFLRFKTASDDPDPPIFVLNASLIGSTDDLVNRFRVEAVLPFVALYGQQSDVVLVGIRGTGAATPLLTCAGTFAPRLDQQATAELIAADLGAYYSTCDEFWTAHDAAPGAYNAHKIAQDVDAARELLGYDTIKLIGQDYGSHVALDLIRNSGESIDRAILAPVQGPDQMMYLPGGAQAVLEELDRRAKDNPSIGSAMPDFLGTVGLVLDRLEVQPATVSVIDPDTLLSYSITVGADDLRHVTARALGTSEQRSLPARYFEMSQGDFTWLAKQAYAWRTNIRGNVMPTAATCASGASIPRQTKVAAEAENSLLENAINGVRFDLCTAVGDPDLGADFREALESDVPVLMISGTMDPYAQPDEVETLLAGFENGQHLIVNGASHNLVEESFPIIAPIVTSFLLEDPLEAIFTTEVSVVNGLEPIRIQPITELGWNGEYFNNRTVQGDPTVQRVDPVIDFNWGEESPAPEINADNFSARWTVSRDVPAGPYRFSVWTDDGVRVWVDDVLIIDQWEVSGARNFVTDVNLVRGLHNAKVEYFESEGLALAQLTVAARNEFPDWKAEYYENPGLQGEPKVVRSERKIDYAWQLQAPVVGIPADNFSVRWTRGRGLRGRRLPGQHRRCRRGSRLDRRPNCER